MNTGHTVKRVLFTASPFILGVVASLAGCSSGEGGSTTQVTPTPTTMDPTTLPPDPTDTTTDLPGFKGSKACQKCHTSIYNDWESSMHAHALTSPVTVVENNQVFAIDLIKTENQGLEQFCVNCHSPIATLFAKDGRLPFVSTKPNATTEALQEGIGCVTCHSYRGNPKDAKAALTDFQQDFAVGKNYFGPFDDPAPNGGFHQASVSPLYASGTENLCLNCHNVKNDRNGDKKFVLGEDLFLQTTFDEYNNDYRIAGGGEQTCLECHMPERPDIGQAADGFPGAPFRTVHEHGFPGVDYPLDLFAKGKDPQKQLRRDLLQGGGVNIPVANLNIENEVFDGAKLDFDVTIENANGGHSLPTGFAFSRQMWLEVLVNDNDKNELASSGVLRDPNNDLCDQDTLNDVLGPNVLGCANNVADPQLVNFQTQLVDFVTLQNGVLIKDPVKGHETWLQFQTGGAVARSRPADVAAGLGNGTLAQIKAFDQRTFHYSFTFSKQNENISLSVRLNFRNLPPYFVRRLAQGDPNQTVPLSSLLSFDVITMQSQGKTLVPPP